MSAVHLPEKLVDRLAAEATRRGVSVDELAAETLAGRFPVPAEPDGTDALEAFIGCGRSGRGDLGRRHREILAAKSAADL